MLLDHHTQLAGFNLSNINHELCHYAGDVTQLAGFNLSNIVNPKNIPRELENHVEKRTPCKGRDASAVANGS
jgi:hypothetical protein